MSNKTGRSASTSDVPPDMGQVARDRARIIAHNTLKENSKLSYKEVNHHHYYYAPPDPGRVCQEINDAAIEDSSAASHQSAPTPKHSRVPRRLTESDVPQPKLSEPASLTTPACVKLYFLGKSIGLASLDTNVQGKWMSVRILERIKDIAPKTFKVKRSNQERRLTYNGVEIRSTGQYIDLIHLDSTTPACHRFYIVPHRSDGFDLLLGPDVA